MHPEGRHGPYFSRCRPAIAFDHFAPRLLGFVDMTSPHLCEEDVPQKAPVHDSQHKTFMTCILSYFLASSATNHASSGAWTLHLNCTCFGFSKSEQLPMRRAVRRCMRDLPRVVNDHWARAYCLQTYVQRSRRCEPKQIFGQNLCHVELSSPFVRMSVESSANSNVSSLTDKHASACDLHQA